MSAGDRVSLALLVLAVPTLLALRASTLHIKMVRLDTVRTRPHLVIV